MKGTLARCRRSSVPESTAVVRAGVSALVPLLLQAGALVAQPSLADYDYENLSFRGVGLEVGYFRGTRLEPAYTMGFRLDLGYLGPGLRVTPSLTYWSSRMKEKEVAVLERRVEALLAAQQGGEPVPQVRLGPVDWSDLSANLDAHLVWSIPLGFLSFVGLGVGAHILNGDGPVVRGTFVEDLLDRVAPGMNLHAGVEYPVGKVFRLYGTVRLDVLEDLRYAEFRMGGQIHWGRAMPGEARDR